MNEKSDADLVVAYQETGDPAAFSTLVHRHQGVAFGYARAVLEDVAMSQDMAQEAFLRAFVNLHMLREPARFAPWLRQIVLRCCQKWLNSRHPELFTSIWDERNEDIPEVQGTEGDPIDELMSAERTRLVLSATASLPDRYRLPILLYYMEGMKLRDIAVHIEAPLGTVKSLISRGRRLLHQILEPYIKEFSPMLDYLSKENVLPEDFHQRVDWLTEALRRSGMLPQGAVSAIEDVAPEDIPLIPWEYSSLRKLSLRFTDDAAGIAPGNLILKIQGEHAGQNEIGFYQAAAEDIEELPMVMKCYGAEYAESTGLSYCLVEDLTATHYQPAGRDQLIQEGSAAFTRKELESMIKAVAQFHAHWWDDPRIGQEAFPVAFPFRNEELYLRNVNGHQKNWERFVEIAGGDIPESTHDLFKHALSKMPALWEGYFRPRFENRKNITLISGHRYANQFLCPNEGTDGSVALPDVWVWGNLGADELAHVLTFFFTSEQRKADNLESDLLHLYRDELKARGVEGFEWDDLMKDYRVKISWHIFHALWDCVSQPPASDSPEDRRSGQEKGYWWPKMQCSLAAYVDHDCAALLDEIASG